MSDGAPFKMRLRLERYNREKDEQLKAEKGTHSQSLRLRSRRFPN